MDYITNKYNNILSMDFVRILLLLLTSVYIGFTLQPVPETLNKLFNNSNLFKFLILFIFGSIALYPLDNKKTINLSMSCIILLYLFNYLRNLDNKPLTISKSTDE
jgi:hypothetical protein